MLVYTATRTIIIGQAIVRIVAPIRSVVAGCTFADLMMFAVMRSAVDTITLAVPQVLAVVVADNF